MKNGNITLIGASNVGKSYWREHLAAEGFMPIRCDDRIEERLALSLAQEEFRGIEGVARWMGQPYETQYAAHQVLYLREEARVMDEAIRLLEAGEDRYVVDTTGSVIYMGEKVLVRLKELTTIVMLDAPESAQEELFQRYLTNGKPVIWGDAFQPLVGEDWEAALARCHPLLLRERDARYRELADVVLDYHELQTPGFTTRNFLERSGMHK